MGIQSTTMDVYHLPKTVDIVVKSIGSDELLVKSDIQARCANCNQNNYYYFDISKTHWQFNCQECEVLFRIPLGVDGTFAVCHTVRDGKKRQIKLLNRQLRVDASIVLYIEGVLIR